METIKRILIIILILLISSCENDQKKDDLVLEIMNNELITYSYHNLKNNDTIIKVIYKLTNNSKKKYFVSFSANGTNGIIFDDYTKVLRIFDKQNNKQVEHYDLMANNNYDSNVFCESILNKKNDSINYYVDKTKNLTFYYKQNYKYNFFINENETIYFESLLKIYAKTPIFNENHANSCKIDKNKKYYAKMYFYCKLNYDEKQLPWHVTQRIKTNDYIVFKGVIESKNSVPIKILE